MFQEPNANELVMKMQRYNFFLPQTAAEGSPTEPYSSTADIALIYCHWLAW